MNKRLKKSVIATLNGKGFTKTQSAPDLLVAYHINVKKKTKVNVYGHGYGYWGPRPVDVHQFKEGTLILDLVDPKTKQLVWRGWGRGVFEPTGDPQVSQARIDEAVSQVLKHYPPY